MSRLHKSLLVAGAGLALAIGGTSAALADPLIIDPSAPNPGGVQIGTVPGTFATTGAEFQFTSDLLIQGGPTTSGGPGGLATSTEVGSFVLFAYQLNNINIPSGVTGINFSGQSSNYTIYGTFSISGPGSWGTGFTANQYQLLPNPTVLITLYASPNGDPQATLNGNANAATGNFGITTNPATDVELGTFSLGTGLSQASATDGGSIGLLSFSGSLAPDLNPDYTGLTGYFENVLSTGLNLSIGTTESTIAGPPAQTSVTNNISPNGTNGCNVGDCTDFYTSNSVSADGSLLYAVPEPASLALLGSALIGFGVIRRRRNRKA